MIWNFWSSRPSVQLKINLGHGLNSWISCVNLLIEHRIQLLKFSADGDRPYLGPISIQILLRHPGRKRLRTLISALNRSTYGCREEVPQDQDSGRVS